MQDILPPTVAQLLAAGQEPLVKLEFYVDPHWINICDLLIEKLVDGGLNIWTTATDLTNWVEFISGTSTVNREAIEKVEGAFSCRIDVDASNSNVYINQVNILLTPLKRYKLIIWYMMSAAGKTAKFSLIDSGSNVYLQDDFTWGAGNEITLANSTIWKKYEIYFYAHADYSNYGITLRRLTSTSSSIYFDKVSIQEISYEIGKNYLESISVSLGGASMTPNPIGGKWSAGLANEGSIFHPDHPTSGKNGYCVTGREVRISIGATYGGVDYYYQRIIGYMDEPKFSAPDYKVSISGQDYMKRLEDAEFQEMDGTHPNHWGLWETFDSWPSDGKMGAELYIEGDAMDIAADANGIGGWGTNHCTFLPLDGRPGDPNQPSNFVGNLTAADRAASYIQDLDIADVTQNLRYKVTFRHRAVGIAPNSQKILVRIYQAGVPIKTNTYYSSDTWIESTIYFTATETDVMGMRINCPPTIADLRLDLFSIYGYVPEEERFHDLSIPPVDANQQGPFYVTYDDQLGGGPVPVQQGEEDEGWWYEEDTEHVFFDRNKTVIDGTGLGNVVIHYYMPTEPEDAVARILWFAGLGFEGTPYANEAAAKAVMNPHDPGFDIPKVWFEAGTSFLSAIKMLCEVCNYRFHFEYDGRPSFERPPVGGVIFTFDDPSQVASQRTYQSRSEIKNRVIIKGIKQAEPVNLDDSVPSELIGDASDVGSIGTYGERTLTITNHLFQDQVRLNAMCVTLRDLYKTPKWYANLKIPFNPVPLELGDEIQWEERLSHDIADKRQTGIIRDIKISKFIVTYKVEITT